MAVRAACRPGRGGGAVIEWWWLIVAFVVGVFAGIALFYWLGRDGVVLPW
jgi:hypothetical protein